MIRMINAHTTEIDDPGAAVTEILEQLDLDFLRDKNAVGILTCYSEFIDTGVVAALCAHLPFDVLGATTTGNGDNTTTDLMLLCLSVIVSDDVFFSTAVTEPLESDNHLEVKVADAYHRAVQALPGEPRMALAFFPMNPDTCLGGEVLLGHLDRAAGGIPIFGTVACDHTPGYKTSRILHKGRAEDSALCVLLFCGNFHPSFVTVAIPDKKIQSGRAIVTESNGNILKRVNDMPLPRYLETLGLSQGCGIEALNVVPLYVDYNDGSPPVARSIVPPDPCREAQGAFCGGLMPEGAALSVGTLEYGDVLDTARTGIRHALRIPGIHGMLAVTCMSRSLVLGTDVLAELEQVRDGVGDKVPYHICYSGGELCPIQGPGGGLVNRFHNFTFTVCVF